MPLDISSLSQDDIQQLIQQLNLGSTGSGGQKGPPVGDANAQNPLSATPLDTTKPQLSDIVGTLDPGTLSNLGISGGGAAGAGGKTGAGPLSAGNVPSTVNQLPGGLDQPSTGTGALTGFTPDTTKPLLSGGTGAISPVTPSTTTPLLAGGTPSASTPGDPLAPAFTSARDLLGDSAHAHPDFSEPRSASLDAALAAVHQAEQAGIWQPDPTGTVSGGQVASGQSLDWSNPQVLAAGRAAYDQSIGRPSTDAEWATVTRDIGLEDQLHNVKLIPTGSQAGDPGLIATELLLAVAGGASSAGAVGAFEGLAPAAAAEGATVAGAEAGTIAAEAAPVLGEAATSFAGATPAISDIAAAAPAFGEAGTSFAGATPALSDAGGVLGEAGTSFAGASPAIGGDIPASALTPLSDVATAATPGTDAASLGVEAAGFQGEAIPTVEVGPGGFSTAEAVGDPTFVDSGTGLGGGSTTPTFGSDMSDLSTPVSDSTGGGEGLSDELQTELDKLGVNAQGTNAAGETAIQNVTGTGGNVGGTADSGGFWSQLKSLYNNPITQIAKTVGSLGLTGYQMLNQPKTPSAAGSENTLNTQAGALNTSAAALTSGGKALTDPLTTGKLPAGAESVVASAVQSAKAAIRSQFATMGMAGSTEEQKALQNVEVNAVNQRFQIAQAMATAGISEISQGNQEFQLSAQIYQNLLQASLTQDRATSTAIANFAAALARA